LNAIGFHLLSTLRLRADLRKFGCSYYNVQVAPSPHLATLPHILYPLTGRIYIKVLIRCPTEELKFQTMYVPLAMARSCISGHVAHSELHAASLACTKAFSCMGGSCMRPRKYRTSDSGTLDTYYCAHVESSWWSGTYMA